MMVFKCRESCKCVKYLSLRNLCRSCSSKVGTGNVSDSEIVSTLQDSSTWDPDAGIENAKTKIIYSSVLHRNHLLSWKGTNSYARKQADKARRERYKMLKEHVFPLAMKYMDEFTLNNEDSGDDSAVNTATLPLAMDDNTEMVVSKVGVEEVVRAEENDMVVGESAATLSINSSLKTQDKNELVAKSPFKRNVPCGGCGAHIQCEDQYNPGFIPLEFLSSISRSQLPLLLCQRCYFTRSLKISLQVNFSPISYLKELNKLRSRRSLILAVFDVTDISHLTRSSISDLVGGHPVFLVGNKVDLLPPDHRGYLNRVRDQIKEFFSSNGYLNIKDVFLVSSVSGIGIENLISKLFGIWKNYGDVYLIGHTNAGKSALFNALLNSDFCKAMSSAGIQTATTSPWPGTTLGILKFPITRPAGIFMFYRSKRLQLEEREKKLAKMEESSGQEYKGYLASPGFFSANNPEDINCELGTTAVSRTVIPLSQETVGHLGVSTSRLRVDGARWCHDTPGIPHPERTLDLLTPDEISYILPGPGMIIPRTFYMKVGLSIFIGGMAQLDYITGECPIWVTVFASGKLPVLLCSTANAEEMYAALLGTHLLGVPRGGRGRLGHWPPLASKVYQVVGLRWRESCADVLLSSAGWTAITAPSGVSCCIRAHTPRGLGISLRTPSLMPYSVLQKGPRRENCPAYIPLKEHLFTKYSS